MTALALPQTPHQPGPPPTTPANPVRAWLMGCAATALTAYWAMGVVFLARGEGGVAGFLWQLLAALPQAVAIALLAAFLTSVPMPLLVMLERALKCRRGLTDAVIGAGLAAGFAQLFGAPVMAGAEGQGLTAITALCGAMGGLTYWLAAGRPN